VVGLTEMKNWRIHNLGRKPEAKRPLCRSRPRWQHKDKMSCRTRASIPFRARSMENGNHTAFDNYGVFLCDIR